MLSVIDKCSVILRATRDGEELSGHHLFLLQEAVNGHLNKRGLGLVDELHTMVSQGTYNRPWLHGQVHLTRRQDGYVFWKEACVEHFTFNDEARERRAAERLARICMILELLGIPVSWNSACDHHQWITTAPGWTTWVKALLLFYTLKSNGACHVLILHQGTGAVGIEASSGNSKVTRHEGAYEAFHYYQDRAFRGMELLEGYGPMVHALESLGFTEEMIREFVE